MLRTMGYRENQSIDARNEIESFRGRGTGLRRIVLDTPIPVAGRTQGMCTRSAQTTVHLIFWLSSCPKGSSKGILRRGPQSSRPEVKNSQEKCQLCDEMGISCRWKDDIAACIACRLKRRPCSAVPLKRAQNRATRNRIAIDGGESE
jgi:hypothetical protein